MNKARKKLFAKSSSVKRIPPSHAALEQHVKRAAFQGGHVRGKALTPHPVLPSPTSWGWVMTDGGLYEPHCPHFKKRQRPVMSGSLAAARRNAVPAASAIRLDSIVLLSASVKENVQQTE